MNTKSTFFVFSTILFLTSIAFSAQAQTETTDADVENIVEEQYREPLEEIVVTAKRRSLINLGDLFSSELEPDFVNPDAMRVESENLPGGRRVERFTRGDKTYCFEVHQNDPMNEFTTSNVFRRRC